VAGSGEKTMKNYAKVGKRPGRPAYRTPAPFRYRQYKQTEKMKAGSGRERGKKI